MSLRIRLPISWDQSGLVRVFLGVAESIIDNDGRFSGGGDGLLFGFAVRHFLYPRDWFLGVYAALELGCVHSVK